MWRKSMPMVILLIVLVSVVGLVTAVYRVASANALPIKEATIGNKVAGVTAANVVTTTVTCTGTNLLENPGFEGEYTAYQYPPPGHPDCQTWNENEPNQHCERANMPAGWAPRWRDVPRDETWMNIMPEYTASTPDQVNPDRVRSGEKSLHYFSFYSTHETAVHQQIAVEPGRLYCFSVWGHAWTDLLTDDYYSATPDRPADDGQLYQRVGIDPTGGDDWQSPTVIWSTARKQYDYFGEFVVTATAQSPTLTVFLHSTNSNPVRFNDVYWDDALLTFPSLAVTPGQIAALAAVTQPVTVTQSMRIDLTEGYTWTAALSLTGSFTPTLSGAMGTGNMLTVTFSTQGLVTGTYTATLTIDAGTEVADSPTHIPIIAYVFPEIKDAYLPIISRP